MANLFVTHTRRRRLCDSGSKHGGACRSPNAQCASSACAAATECDLSRVGDLRPTSCNIYVLVVSPTRPRPVSQTRGALRPLHARARDKVPGAAALTPTEFLDVVDAAICLMTTGSRNSSVFHEQAKNMSTQPQRLAVCCSPHCTTCICERTLLFVYGWGTQRAL